MLDFAKKYEEQLKQLYRNTATDPRYRYIFSNGYWEELELSSNTWKDVERVSINPYTHNIIGFISFTPFRVKDLAFGLFVVNFDMNNVQSKYIFSRDLKTAILDIFYLFNFNLLRFSCSSEIPLLEKNRKLVAKYGGREVGYFTNDFLDTLGVLSDRVTFEIDKASLNKALFWKESKEKY